jgi:potassium efflux system protein
LGFGLQEIVANFVSGLILLLERPVRVGDAVKIGTLQGRVTRTQIRATTIQLFDRSEMIVPNKDFITKPLINWTLSDPRRRVDIPVRVSYGTELERVKEILLSTVRDHPEVLKDPPPRALVQEMGDDAFRLELRFYVEFMKGLSTKDEVLVAIDKAFKEHGVEYALPKLRIQIPQEKQTEQNKPVNLSFPEE